MNIIKIECSDLGGFRLKGFGLVRVHCIDCACTHLNHTTIQVLWLTFNLTSDGVTIPSIFMSGFHVRISLWNLKSQ